MVLYLKRILALLKMLVILDFDKLFEVECDVCKVSIEVILYWEKRLIAYLRKKLSGAKLKWSTNDKDFFICLFKLLDIESHTLSIKSLYD